MKNKNNVLLILLSLLLVMLSACKSKSEQIYNEYSKDSESSMNNITDAPVTDDIKEEQNVNESISGELVIYVGNINNNISNLHLIENFNKEYPNVQVTIKCQDSSSSIEDYMTKASVALMSGTAGDIIELLRMPYFKMAQNDLLEDLYPYMENDPTFRKEDYYTNVFDALEYKDKLYSVPLGFYYYNYRFNEALLEENKIDVSQFNTVSYKNIFDVYHQISKNKEDLILSKMMIPTDIETDEYISYFDEKNGTANFNSKGFIDYLKEMKTISWPETMPDVSTIYEYLTSLESNELCGHFPSSYNDPNEAAVFNSSSMTPAVPVSTSNGNKPLSTATTPLAIPSSSKNKELAWLFISFCIKERDIEDLDLGNTYFVDGYPINRKNALKQLEKAFGPGHEEDIAKIDAWNSERNCITLKAGGCDLFIAIDEITSEFYAGRMTAEECAEKVQERAEIYIKE